MRAKEVRRVAERLIAIAVREQDNYTEAKVTTKVPRKNAQGRHMKEDRNGKRVTVFDRVERTIKKDNPSRLFARRRILSVLYPVVEAPKDKRKMRSESKRIDMAEKMFSEIAPKYTNRNGGYTRMIKIGPRKGDAAEMVVLELV